MIVLKKFALDDPASVPQENPTIGVGLDGLVTGAAPRSPTTGFEPNCPALLFAGGVPRQVDPVKVHVLPGSLD